MPLISFEVTAEVQEEVLHIAAEMGVSVEDIASTAFEVYLDGARSTRQDDLDELEDESGMTSNVTRLEQPDVDETFDLEGTELWLTTEDEPNGSLAGIAPMPEFIAATAEVRGEYRYTLTRVWDVALPMITFVLLNPSTADAVQLDPTLRRCVGFAKREGYGGMVTSISTPSAPKTRK